MDAPTGGRFRGVERKVGGTHVLQTIADRYIRNRIWRWPRAAVEVAEAVEWVATRARVVAVEWAPGGGGGEAGNIRCLRS